MASQTPHSGGAVAALTVLYCARCGNVMREDDFGDLGLRLPEAGESSDEYMDAELLDTICHAHCVDASTKRP